MMHELAWQHLGQSLAFTLGPLLIAYVAFDLWRYIRTHERPAAPSRSLPRHGVVRVHIGGYSYSLLHDGTGDWVTISPREEARRVWAWDAEETLNV